MNTMTHFSSSSSSSSSSSKSWRANLLTIGLVVVAVVAISLLFLPRQHHTENMSGDGQDNSAASPSASASASTSTFVFYFFSASWCPHCRKVADLWTDLTGDTSRANMTYVKVDCSDPENKESKQKKNTYSVDSFPTFVLVRTGAGANGDADAPVKYQGDMALDKMNEFLNNAAR